MPARAIPVMWIGNLILFGATLASFFIYRKSIHQVNMHKFLRAVYGSMLLKMMVCMVSLLIYVLVAPKGVSWPGLAVCFAFYFLYTFVEVKLLMRLSKQPDNA
jgi:hypothetical protein